MAATMSRSTLFSLLAAALIQSLVVAPALAVVLVPDTSLPRVPSASSLPSQASAQSDPVPEGAEAFSSSSANGPLNARKLQQNEAFVVQIGGSKAGAWVSCPLKYIASLLPDVPSVCVGTTSKANATRFNAYGYKIKNNTWYAIKPDKSKSLCLTLYNTTGSTEEKLAPIAAYMDFCRTQSKNSTLPLPASQLWASGRYSSTGKYTGVFEGHGYVLAYTGAGKPIAGRYLCNPDKTEACIASVVRAT